MRRLALLALIPLALVLPGCSNVWRSNYFQNPAFRDVRFEPTQEVVIRRVERERLEAYHLEAAARAAARDLAPDEWPLEWQLEEKSAFLRALRVTGSPREVFFLGSSEFTHAGTVDIFGGELRDFARSIGADYAVVAEQFVGVRDTIVHVPVYTTVYGTTFRSHGRRGRGGWTSDYGTVVTHEPRVMAVDTFHYIAYFLRRTTEEEFDRMRGE